MAVASTDAVVAATDASTASSADERISHRGPMRRWLATPEIGALIGAIIVWAFFWGNGNTFGNAGSTLNWLDVAAPTGIMAVAVALLMIGGEFDLSAGVITGASAILIGLFSKHFMGEGVNIGLAIGAAFLAAIALGWFNGTMVNRTGLPSFIVTLASFFVLQGIMLVMSQRVAKKVQVSEIDEQRGFAFFKNWVAHEWRPQYFTGRNVVFLTLCFVGVSLFAIGLMEQSFVRRRTANPAGALAGLIGIALALFGFNRLLNTDGVSQNVTWGVASAAGVVLAAAGFGLFRYDRRSLPAARGGLPKAASLRLGLGLAAAAIACLVPIPFDRDEGQPILTWMSSGFRPIIAILAAIVGVGLAWRAGISGLRARPGAKSVLKLSAGSAYTGLVVMVGLLSFLQLSTVQALRAILMMAAGGAAFVLLLSARGHAGRSSAMWQMLIGVLTSVAAVVVALVVRHDAGAVRFRTGLCTAIIVIAVFQLVNTLVEVFFAKRHVAEPAADRFGRWCVRVGAALACSGVAIRLIWSNPNEEQAAAIKAAGGKVAQNVLRQTVVWWILVTVIGTLVLTKSKWGNWIFSVGGNKDAARAIGVPANKVKVGLFMTVSVCGCLAGTLVALRYGTVQANYGVGLEFEFIIAAVIGGNLLTGGYGSVVGASIGAAIMAMSGNGIQVTGWDYNGRFAFLGGVLLLSVLVNNFTRKKAMEAR